MTNEKTNLTQHGTVLGTPQYMSPEQACGDAVDERTDLFSLGCVLYRMLTGNVPFAGATTMAVLTALVERQPPSVRSLNPDVPDELDRLVMRLIAKRREDRPASAREVIEAFDGIVGWALLPVPAVQEKRTGRSAHPTKRVAAWLLGIVALAAVIVVQTDRGTVRIDAANDDVRVVVEQNGRQIDVLDRRNRFSVRLRSGEYTLRLDASDVQATLERDSVTIRCGGEELVRIVKVEGAAANAQKSTREPRVATSATTATLDSHDPKHIPASERFEWQPKELVAVLGSHARRHWGPVLSIAATPDGRRAVIAEGNESAQLWDIAAAEPRLLRTFPRPKTGSAMATYPVAISADGQTIWTGGTQESSRLLSFTGEGDNVRESVHGVLPLTSVALSPDGRRAFTGGTGGTLELRHVSEDSSRAVQPFDFTKWVERVQFTPENAGLWFGTSRARVGRADITNGAFGNRRQELTDLDVGTTFAVAPDGEWFVSANFNSLVQLWQYDGGVPRKQATANPGGYNAGYVAISPDHHTIAVQVENFVTSVLRLEGNQLVESARVTGGVPVAITPDQRWLITTLPVEHGNLYDLTVTPPRRAPWPKDADYLRSATLSADGRSLFANKAGGELVELDLTGDAPRFVRTLAVFPDWKYTEPPLRFTPTPDGQRLFVFDPNGQSWWLNLEPRDATRTSDPPPKLTPAWTFPGAIKRAEFSRDGRHLLLVNLNGTAYVLRL